MIKNVVSLNSQDIAPIAIYNNGGSPPFYNATADQKIHNYTPPYPIGGNWYFATPWLWLDGDKDAGWECFSQSNLNNLVTKQIAVPAGLEIQINGSLTSDNDTLNLDFNITNIDTISYSGFFHAILTEDEIYWKAPNGQQIHDFVPRIWWPNATGSEIIISQGNTETLNANWIIDQSWVVGNLSIVAFVQDDFLQPDSTLEIHQGAKVKVTQLTTGIKDNSGNLIQDFQLYQNFPNPFNPQTTIDYYLTKKSQVSLKIYNLSGQEVKSLVGDIQNPGKYSIVWDGRNNFGENVSTGVYLYMLQAGNKIQSRKMILLR